MAPIHLTSQIHNVWTNECSLGYKDIHATKQTSKHTPWCRAPFETVAQTVNTQGCQYNNPHMRPHSTSSCRFCSLRSLPAKNNHSAQSTSKWGRMKSAIDRVNEQSQGEPILNERRKETIQEKRTHLNNQKSNGTKKSMKHKKQKFHLCGP